MIKLRELQDKDLKQAIQLKALCWPEELAGSSKYEIDFYREYEFWSSWMHSGIDNYDVRVLLGAFKNDRMLGVAFASFSEKEDSDCGVELNGLWVYPEMRGRGISLMLLTKIFDYYEFLGIKEVIIYNYHNAPSNAYYRKFGAKVYKTHFQLKERVPTDIFKADIFEMNKLMKKSLGKYDSSHRYEMQ